MSGNVTRIAILGSTGSIGRQTLEVIRSFPQRFSVVGLAGWNNLRLLREQLEEFHPALVCCKDISSLSLPQGFSKYTGVTMEEMVCHPKVDMVVAASTGPTSLPPILKALRSNKIVVFASKEAIVMAGSLIAQEMARGATLLPVDSEPSAIWQCLQGEDQDVARLIITASGGAFRSRPIGELVTVTPEEALQHPTWHMGKKITVDSATLINKAFEVVEAHWLFDVPWDKIEVTLHPQSIIHSLVEFQDGSIKAQMAVPDMRLPIQYALLYPKRMPNNQVDRLDINKLGTLSFDRLEDGRYPCFSIALEAAKAGGTYPAALCAADDVAVWLFLNKMINFTDISNLIQLVINEHQSGSAVSLDDVMGAETRARRRALELAKSL
ncbi:1-deoxy-D-xylulose-5-phosphate reductoisomerase [Dehalococcoidia bacterium]|nr:1-deoxy-D-xylulose-5-phosphate reductoisomerase [Dehalococcoidia bacterium]